MKTHIPAIGPFLDERREEEAGMTGCDSRSNPCWEPLRAFIQLFTKRGGFKEPHFPSSQRRAQPPMQARRAVAGGSVAELFYDDVVYDQ